MLFVRQRGISQIARNAGNSGDASSRTPKENQLSVYNNQHETISLKSLNEVQINRDISTVCQKQPNHYLFVSTATEVSSMHISIAFQILFKYCSRGYAFFYIRTSKLQEAFGCA